MFELDDYLQHLQSPDPNVRRNAAWNLGRFRDLRIIDPLLACIDDLDNDVRLRVAESLGNLRDPKIVGPLLTRLQIEPEIDIRAQLIASLGRQGQTDAMPALFEVLTDLDPVIRAAAVEAIGEIGGDMTIIDPLISVLFHDPDENTRYLASKALARIGGTHTVDHLSAALGDPTIDAEARLKAIEILVQIGDRRARNAITPLKDSDDPLIAETAAWALKQLT
ncbi:MAG: HEAT repeat domain-containing protein [Anaerolineae bacterium]|nr:HEAT repeat domain-containing protein [Anaerolineae bacterium]